MAEKISTLNRILKLVNVQNKVNEQNTGNILIFVNSKSKLLSFCITGCCLQNWSGELQCRMFCYPVFVRPHPAFKECHFLGQ